MTLTKFFKVLSAILAVGYLWMGIYFLLAGVYLSRAGGFRNAEWYAILGVGVVIYSLYSFVPFDVLARKRWLRYSCFVISPIVLVAIGHYLFSEYNRSDHDYNGVLILIFVFIGAAINFISNIFGLLLRKKDSHT